MNFSLLIFLHGEQVLVGMALAVLIALIGVPLVLYVWLWHTKVSELQLACAYLVFVAVLCAVSAFSLNGPPSTLSLTPFVLSFLLTLPWSAVGGFGLSEIFDWKITDVQFAVIMVLGALINSVLLYFAAVRMRRLIE